MTDEITAYLLRAMELLEKEEKSRENSLALTKVEEALQWWRQSQHLLRMKVEGVNI